MDKTLFLMDPKKPHCSGPKTRRRCQQLKGYTKQVSAEHILKKNRLALF